MVKMIWTLGLIDLFTLAICSMFTVNHSVSIGVTVSILVQCFVCTGKTFTLLDVCCVLVIFSR